MTERRVLGLKVPDHLQDMTDKELTAPVSFITMLTILDDFDKAIKRLERPKSHPRVKLR